MLDMPAASSRPCLAGFSLLHPSMLWCMREVWTSHLYYTVQHGPSTMHNIMILLFPDSSGGAPVLHFPSTVPYPSSSALLPSLGPGFSRRGGKCSFNRDCGKHAPHCRSTISAKGPQTLFMSPFQRLGFLPVEPQVWLPASCAGG